MSTHITPGAATDIPSLLGPLRASGALHAIDVEFASAMARLGAETRSEVILAAALASRRVGEGHVCLDLHDPPALPIPMPNAASWRAVLATSPLVGGAEGATPLVLDSGSRLYLRRYFETEQRLAARLGSRAGTARPQVGNGWIDARLDRLFGADPSATDIQRAAARAALTRRLTVVSGGPGTGKTSTVVRIMALIIEAEAETGGAPPRILLVAPTGKAAARLGEAIDRARAQVNCDEATRALLIGATSTIHRALGTLPNRITEFRHHRGNPLAADLVVVDEASMVDLALMERLVDAVPDTARLILLGDKNQLASVEAGAVLGDICQGLEQCTVHLTRSFRYGAESGIAHLADAIQRNDLAAAREAVSGRFDDLRLVPLPGEASPREALRSLVADGYRGLCEAADARSQLAALGHFRVLCAHRHGLRGVEHVNRAIADILRGAGLMHDEGDPAPGTPLMVTRNDYGLRLFNGDVGVVRRADGGQPPGHRVWFDAGALDLRDLSLTRLPPHEAVFAMTVHKSQGSEFDEVVIVLPAAPSPIVSRELLYTAVTRARKRVTLVADLAVLEHAVRTPVVRASGLAEQLRGFA